MKSNFQKVVRVAAIAAMAVGIGAGGAWGYPSASGCVTCHIDFDNSASPLHQSHVLSLEITGSPGVIDNLCNVCHSDGGGSTPVRTYGSNLTQGNGWGCAGCHGQDYGETVNHNPMTGYNYFGQPKASGYGLRLVHEAAEGPGTCISMGCHVANPHTPLTEQDQPPYYTMNVSKLGNPCLSTQEDMAYDGDSLGLDNDGNGLRDYPDDPNCLLPTTTTSTTTTTLPPAECGVAPAGGCIAAEKAKLQLNEKKAGKEKMKFQMVKLTSNVVQSDFGNPLVGGGTTYALCVYDQANTLVASYQVDRDGQTCGTKPCFSDFKAVGYKYQDKDQFSDGVFKMQFQGGVAGTGKIKVQGKNDSFALPTGLPAILAGDTSATVQLITSDAQCFGMALPTVKKNDSTLFQAQAP